MNSAKFLGNCSDVIDWNTVIEDIKQQIPPTIAPMRGEGYSKRVPDKIEMSDELNKTFEIWDAAGYKTTDEGGSVEWHMFYPGSNFDESIVKKFCDRFNIEHYDNCWISVIHPGHISPWHVDQYKIKDTNNRYHCHMGMPEMGHIFMLENDYFVNGTQGDTFVWNNPKAWHSGVNAGRSPKFLFNLY
jgi:hypothetical protein